METDRMDKVTPDGIKVLREEVSDTLRNKLTYPKTALAIAQERRLTADEAEKGQALIDESIKVIDVRFADFLMGLEEDQKPSADSKS